jgi:hypothetical protein
MFKAILKRLNSMLSPYRKREGFLNLSALPFGADETIDSRITKHLTVLSAKLPLIGTSLFHHFKGGLWDDVRCHVAIRGFLVQQYPGGSFPYRTRAILIAGECVAPYLLRLIIFPVLKPNMCVGT